MDESNTLYQDGYGNVTEAAHRIEVLEAENGRLGAENERRYKIQRQLDVLIAYLQDNNVTKVNLGDSDAILTERRITIAENSKLREEIAGLRAALVEERAKAEFLASKYHKDYEFFTYVWDRADGETAIQKAVALDKARAALGNHPETPDSSANPSETPISSGMRRDDE